MKKILAFLGSPRKNGATAKVVEQVIAGATAEGDQPKIRPRANRAKQQQRTVSAYAV